MKITIISVGKIKEKYLRDGIAEYTKRLGRYCKLDQAELPDEKTPDGASAAVEIRIKEIEGERILRSIRDTDYVIALAIEGKMLDSPELASYIDSLGVQGKSSLVFVIGGSLGLSDAVLKRADYKLSFSKMTFPHQLMKMILLEQLYRSYRIIHGEPYHK
ncbi:MAG: 23S rRNA (pseudouridine(1915)-N(3))-methyltransferase RlmH [Lachnospiraceae bacterium]|nr:23S rRNA (pseudouridine(1915)-N(3))-methyltransferase RlmH [Lachnospiraceae bacterium]